MLKSRKLIVANWKMAPESLAEAKKTFTTFIRRKPDFNKITAVICPPSLYLSELKKSYHGEKIFFGAQNIHWQDEVSNTGELSVSMVKNAGARFVIVGHSERRALGENNQAVCAKALHALEAGLHTILCIGENLRNESGSYLKFIDEQLRESLEGIKKEQTKNLIIAYEPIWAIGKGKKAMTPHEIYQTILYIRKKLINIFGQQIAMKLPILYGGSVNDENALEIINEGQVDGLLIGRASLNPYTFADLINSLNPKKAEKTSPKKKLKVVAKKSKKTKKVVKNNSKKVQNKKKKR